jgi:molybdopterin biosynthesis enzyme MoaB
MKTFKQLVESLNEAWPKPSDAKGFTGKGSDGKQTGNRHNIETKGGVTKVTRKYDAKTGESDEPKQAASGEAPVKRGRGRPPGKYGSYKKKVAESIEIIESLESEEEIAEFIDSLDEESFDELHDFLESVDLEEAMSREQFMKGNSPIEQKTDAELQLHMKKKVEGPGSATWRKLIKKEVEKRKSKNEEVELEEEQLDELSKDTLKSYVKKAATGLKSASRHAFDAGRTMATDDEQSGKSFNKALNRGKGVVKAVDKLTKEEVEQIDELSKTKLKAYVDKAVDRTAAHAYIAGGGTGQTDKATTKKEFSTAVKRIQGVRKATTRLAKEEVESIDELSKSTLGSYVKKANKSTADNARGSATAGEFEPNKDEIRAKAFSKTLKRMKGVDKATDRLTKEDVEQETQLDESVQHIADFITNNKGN